MKKFLILLLLLTPIIGFAAVIDDVDDASVVPVPTSVKTSGSETDSGFVSLVPIVGLETRNPNTSLADYVNNLFVLIISLAAMLAVLRIIVGGFEYMTKTDSPKSTTNARETIQNAAIGLILLLSTYLIFSTINPNIVDLEALKFSELGPTPEVRKGIIDAAVEARKGAAAERAKVDKFANEGEQIEDYAGNKFLQSEVDVTNPLVNEGAYIAACASSGGTTVKYIEKRCHLKDGTVVTPTATKGTFNPYLDSLFLRDVARKVEIIGNITANQCPLFNTVYEEPPTEKLLCRKKI